MDVWKFSENYEVAWRLYSGQNVSFIVKNKKKHTMAEFLNSKLFIFSLIISWP